MLVVSIQDFKSSLKKRILSSNIILQESLMLIAEVKCFSEAREWLGGGVQNLPQLYLKCLSGIPWALI